MTCRWFSFLFWWVGEGFKYDASMIKVFFQYALIMLQGSFNYVKSFNILGLLSACVWWLKNVGFSRLAPLSINISMILSWPKVAAWYMGVAPFLSHALLMFAFFLSTVLLLLHVHFVRQEIELILHLAYCS